MEGYQRPSVWQVLARAETEAGEGAAVREFDNSIVSGFQLAALAGPMCEEPLMGVCFSVERWDIHPSAVPQPRELPEDSSGPQDALMDEAEAQVRRRQQEGASADCYRPVSGQLIAAVKEACRRAFQAQPQRLMAAMYTCEIMATADVLGEGAINVLMTWLEALHGCSWGHMTQTLTSCASNGTSCREQVECTASWAREKVESSTRR